ncbi:MAG TPA: hypothetical protein VLZ54_10435 [Arenibacter sp.]|nr:hypothetical protein [Arenibacter sp.]
MSSCKEVEIICTKIQYREATILEKIRIRVHLCMCRTCRNFSKKNHKLSLLCKDANFRTLPIADKEKMKKNLSSMN